MPSNLSAVSLGIAVLSLGVAGFAVMENRSLRAELEDRQVISADESEPPVEVGTSADVLERLRAVEAEVARVEKASTNRMIPSMPTLEGREATTPAETATDPGNIFTVDKADEKIETMVDAAVERKAREIQAMANKKPAMDVFASTLELTEEQRQTVEQEVIRGQQEIRSLLEQPTDSGHVFLDEVVDIMAAGMAKPGSAQKMWPEFLKRVTTELVPGTNQTYAEAAEAVKDTVRSTFRREFSEPQYAKFEAWKMDPTEVQGIDGSPWTGLQERIIERAREMGAKIPGDDR